MAVGRSRSADGNQVGYVVGEDFRPVAGASSTLDLLSRAGEPGSPAPFSADLPVDWSPSLRDCVGFLDHVRNARRSRDVLDELPPQWFDRPAFYFANPASLHAPQEPVAIPTGCERFDFEFEVAAVLTSGGVNLTAAEAAACIGGYVLYCDWSARDIQSEERVMQIGQGKGKDGAVSLGPWILTAAEAEALRREDGLDIDATVTINDEVVLHTPFLGMDWSFEELVAYASLGAGVQAGDLIASGTVPGGCLMESSHSTDFRGWLQPGDQVVLDGGPLGAISTRITDPLPPVAWRRTTALHTPA
ncbi:fumarylacetoacetate hydrolase family protein [Ornithinimicrobium faecis]|uniref:fumarylacetoacetate hydrolase family protein n=1 Tax=Ornithinimicrobium faecis TaxID=2934158 RepID=UPI0021197756|nr:fumarylacetoacetate hydrolase family protein [Ornithinimicrobium sp. HY1745]